MRKEALGSRRGSDLHVTCFIKHTVAHAPVNLVKMLAFRTPIHLQIAIVYLPRTLLIRNQFGRSANLL